MKILVAIKRVPDADTRIRVRADKSGIETDSVKFSINPFDAIGLEEAVRIKERAADTEIVVVSIGAEACVEQLRAALAMGADRALLVPHEGDLDSLVIAKLLAAVCRHENPGLVLLGKQAIDDDSSQAGPMLAALLGYPQATFVSKLELPVEGKMARCNRETDGGIETIEVPFPAVITVDLRLNEPRYVSLPNILKAKKKPLETLREADLGVSASARSHLLRLEAPKQRRAPSRVKTVDELVAKLRGAAKVL